MVSNRSGRPTRPASRLRIDFRQLVGDVEAADWPRILKRLAVFDGDIVEEDLHIDADSFAVTVDTGPVRGFASHPGTAHRGQDRGDDETWSRRVGRPAMARAASGGTW